MKFPLGSLKVATAALSINSLPITPLGAAEIKRPEPQMSAAGAKLAAGALKVIRTLQPFKDVKVIRPEGVYGNSLLVSFKDETQPKGSPRKLASIDRGSGAVVWSKTFDLPVGNDRERIFGFSSLDKTSIGMGSLVYNEASGVGSYSYRIFNIKNGEEIAFGKLADSQYQDSDYMHLSGHKGKLLVLFSDGIFRVDPKLKAPQQLGRDLRTGPSLSLISEGSFFYLNRKSADLSSEKSETWTLNGLSSVPGAKLASYEIGTGINATSLFRGSNGNFNIILEPNPIQTSLLSFDLKTKKSAEVRRFDHLKSQEIVSGSFTRPSNSMMPMLGLKSYSGEDDGFELFSIDPNSKITPRRYSKKLDDSFCDLLVIDPSRFITATISESNPGAVKIRLYSLRDNQIFEDSEQVIKTSVGFYRFYGSPGNQIYLNTGKGVITELEIVPGVSKALSSKN